MKHILSIIAVAWLAGCSLPDDQVDTPAPPFISFATSSLTVIDVGRLGSSTVDTTMTVSASARGTNVTSVTALIVASDGTIRSFALSDNGAAPDERKNDGVFTGTVKMTLSKAAVGQYGIQLQAADASGLFSNIIAIPLTIISSNNRPPFISNLIAPDTVRVPSGSAMNYIKVSVAAADSDGLGSIASVMFKSYRPDGSFVAEYPMYDDGGLSVLPVFNLPSGDDAAGDGRYTLQIPITSTTTPGTYRDFIFSAKDKSGAVSNSLTKRIYIQ